MRPWSAQVWCRREKICKIRLLWTPHTWTSIVITFDAHWVATELSQSIMFIGRVGQTRHCPLASISSFQKKRVALQVMEKFRQKTRAVCKGHAYQ